LLGILVATLPAIVIALAAHRFIDKLPPPGFVAWVLIGGGALLWAADQWRPFPRLNEAEDFGWGVIITIGCAQTLAMLLPGLSRSGATIIAALLLGATNKAAAEFSFFLSIPTMFMACTYSLFKHRHDLAASDTGIFVVGFVVAFVSAFLVVKGFLTFLQRHSFKVFAYYRVALGIVVLLVK
jgi:undecaprenyl-diphosphatase